MAITYDVIEQGTVVLQYWTGKVTRDDVVAHEHQHLRDLRITPGASVLVDARTAYWGTMADNMRAIVDSLYATYPHPLNIQKCALLVNPQTYPLARACEKNADKYGMSIMVFTFLNGACAWLALDPAMIKPHLERIKKSCAALP